MALTSIFLKQNICKEIGLFPVQSSTGSEYVLSKNISNAVSVPPTWVGYDYDLTTSPCTGGNNATNIWGWEFQTGLGQIFFPSPIRLDNVVAMQAIIDSQLIPSLGLTVGDIIYVVNPDNTVTEWLNPSISAPIPTIVIGDQISNCDKIDALTPTVHTAPSGSLGDCNLTPLAYEIPTPKVSIESSKLIPFVDLPVIQGGVSINAQLLKYPIVYVQDMPKNLIDAGILLECGVFKRSISRSAIARGKKTGFTIHSDWNGATATTTFVGSQTRGGGHFTTSGTPLPYDKINFLPVTGNGQEIPAWITLTNILAEKSIYFRDVSLGFTPTPFLMAQKNTGTKANRPGGGSAEYFTAPKKAPTYFAFRYVLPYTDVNGKQQFRHGGWSQTMVIHNEREVIQQDISASQNAGVPIGVASGANHLALEVHFA